jgi:hypothetical protein
MLFSMVQYVPLFKYATLLGLILVIIDVIWSWIINRDSQKEKRCAHARAQHFESKTFRLAGAGNQVDECPENSFCSQELGANIFLLLW